MKIGIVTEYFYPTIGGITENIYNFALHLLKRGRDFRIITAYRPIPAHVDDEVRRRVIFIGKSVPVGFNGSVGRVSVGRGLTRRMKEVFRSEKFDIIHAHSPLFPTLPAIANMQQNAPYVGTFHTCMEGHRFFKTFDPVLNKALGRMAGRIAVSNACADENRELFGRHFDVIANGVDVDWWQTDEQPYDKFNDGKTNILFLGRPDIRNGLDYLIRAFELIKKRCPNTRLIIVGGGPLLKFFKQMVPHDIADDVHFEGTADITRPRYLKSAHIFCFLPAIASFGITVLEGMAAGKAMVVSDIEAFRALVKHEESALLANPHDEQAIADSICRLVENPELREKLGHQARHDVWPYSWEHITERHLEYYENILD